MRSIQVFGEGNTDRAVLQSLLADSPIPCAVLARDPDAAPGRDAMLRLAAVRARTLPHGVIVIVLDRNGHTEAGLHAEVREVLAREWQRADLGEGPWWRHAGHDVHLVLAGLPESLFLVERGVTRRCMDDYLLELFLDSGRLANFLAGENHLSFRPKDAAQLKGILVSVAAELDAQGVRLDSAKRYVHIVQAVLGFEATRATLAGHLVSRAPPALRDRVLGTLRTDILQAPPPPVKPA